MAYAEIGKEKTMNTKAVIGACLVGLFIAPGLIRPAQKIQLQLGHACEVGRQDLLFGSLADICEDSEGNFYIVDQLEHKVFKFSPAGKMLKAFGQEGQGPGDFQRPNRIALTGDGNLAIANEMYHVSFLTSEGAFLERIQLDRALAPGFIGADRYYAWRWSPDGREQILLDTKSNILQTFHSVSRDTFSISIPDQTGREVMFNYGRPAYAPGLMYSHNQGHTAVARSDSYRIQILDKSGRETATLERQIKPSKLNKDEKRFFEREFQELGRMRGWPERAVSDIIKRLPDIKTYFDRILLSPTHAFVCRIGSDITQENQAVEIDVFTLKGDFMGTTTLSQKPLHISQSRIYFVKSDEDGNVWLMLQDYLIE
jgi:hypothetical protein